MTINRSTFFAYARRSPFGDRLTQQQVDGMTDILDEWDANYSRLPLTYLACYLGQAFRETGGTMAPVRETFATSDKQAMARLETAWTSGKLPSVKTPYWRKGWFGRGRIQVTHAENYAYAQTKSGLPIFGDRSLMLDSKAELKVSLPGTIEGWWTRGKHRMSMYLDRPNPDFEGARRIVNGTDKAKLVATYCEAFLAALKAAEIGKAQPADALPALAVPDDIKPVESKSLWSALLTFATGGGGLAFLGAIDNPMSLAAFALVLAAGGIGLWLVLTGRVTFNRRPAA
ncbi:Chitinase class I [Hyphomicrobiales bacterium]|nr:Chitinase class I [Hyphomicrobiales bacterium]CAH1667592.1 Chitinase class I [Hyphomicrobiales bacterium]